MPLSEHEKSYIRRIVDAEGDLYAESLLEVINKKRKGEKVELTELVSFLEEFYPTQDVQNIISDDVSTGKPTESTQLKKARNLLNRENKNEDLSDTIGLAAEVLEALNPALKELISPTPSNYKILSAKTQLMLEVETNKHIKMGWRPLGGVGAAAFGLSPVAGNQYLQAMVKYE